MATGIFAPGPVVSGSKSSTIKTGGTAHCWKYCPYSTQITAYNGDARVPTAEKVFHQETNGFMHSYSISGFMGWVCANNGCRFYTGTAVATVNRFGRKFVPTNGPVCSNLDLPTLSGSVQNQVIPRTIVSGTRYIEI